MKLRLVLLLLLVISFITANGKQWEKCEPWIVVNGSSDTHPHLMEDLGNVFVFCIGKTSASCDYTFRSLQAALDIAEEVRENTGCSVYIRHYYDIDRNTLPIVLKEPRRKQ